MKNDKSEGHPSFVVPTCERSETGGICFLAGNCGLAALDFCRNRRRESTGPVRYEFDLREPSSSGSELYYKCNVRPQVDRIENGHN